MWCFRGGCSDALRSSWVVLDCSAWSLLIGVHMHLADTSRASIPLANPGVRLCLPASIDASSAQVRAGGQISNKTHPSIPAQL